MKKRAIYYLFSLILSISFSCQNDVPLIDDNVETYSSIIELEKNYDVSLKKSTDCQLKGYTNSIPKDEISPTQDEETSASNEIINYLKASIIRENNSESSKTERYSPGYSNYMVGVFKSTTCGNYPEFIYYMDCEDGGWTNVSNPRNRAFATKQVRNFNLEIHMCVVKGANFGGFALALGDINDNQKKGNMLIAQRYHDTEDNDNRNNVISDLKPDKDGYIGMCQFTNNTLFTWVWDWSNTSYYIPFSFGVIAPDGEIEIGIDDENKKNANWARYQDWRTVSDRESWTDFPYRTDMWGMNLWENTSYLVRLNN